MNDGQFIAWVSDVWAPGDMPSASPSNTGKWSMTELPQWTAGAHVVGNWGGSSTAVLAASKHQQAAAEFAAWLNTSSAATAALASDSGVYPADIAAESSLSTPPSYFSNQPDFWSLAKQYSAEASPVSWGPDVDVAYTEFTTAFGGLWRSAEVSTAERKSDVAQKPDIAPRSNVAQSTPPPDQGGWDVTRWFRPFSVARTRLYGFVEPWLLATTFCTPITSNTARIGPPAITPVPSFAGARRTADAPCLPCTSCCNVPFFSGTLNMLRRACSIAF